MLFFKKKPPFSKHIAITPPNPAPGRHGVAIAAIIKNEGAYIEEWLRFHVAVGVRHFYLYDDGSVDESISIVRRTLSPENVTIFPWHGRLTDVSVGKLINMQIVAFAHAILNFGSAYRWMAFNDVDEFLLPRHGATIEEALEGAQGFPNISLPWHMFGTSGHEKRPRGPMVMNYHLRARDPLSRRKNASNFKCIVDPCEVSEVSVHHFETRSHGDLTANDVGKVTTRRGRKRPEFYSARYLQLNHYYSKSREELNAKLNRGSVSVNDLRYRTRVTTAMQSIEADMVEDRAMMDFVRARGIELSGG